MNESGGLIFPSLVFSKYFFKGPVIIIERAIKITDRKTPNPFTVLLVLDNKINNMITIPPALKIKRIVDDFTMCSYQKDSTFSLGFG